MERSSEIVAQPVYDLAFYRAYLTDEQCKNIWEEVKLTKRHQYAASYYQIVNTENWHQFLKDFEEEFEMREEDLLPSVKQLAQAIEGAKFKMEYAKKVYADEDAFNPVQLDLQATKKHLKKWYDQQNIGMDLSPEYKRIYVQLCAYFAGDKETFEGDLNKGLMLYGCVGDGKTSLMRAFSLNQRNSYSVVSVKQIGKDYKEHGMEVLKPFGSDLRRSKNKYGQSTRCFCFDDVGTEGIYKNYGDELNIVEDIVLMRYDAGLTTHFTTNQDFEYITKFYGERVSSRLLKMVNVIELPNTDLRREKI